jgi:hypothetical protein
MSRRTELSPLFDLLGIPKPSDEPDVPRKGKRTTPRAVNAALAAAGLDVEIVRHPKGYYWFCDQQTTLPARPFNVPSLYQNSLRGVSTEDVVEHVRQALS